MTRACAREAPGATMGLMPRLRKGRDRCTATRRDGWPCQAPAVAGALVCRRHGGAAPQVLIAAKHFELQMRHFDASRQFEEAGGQAGVLAGTSQAFHALCKLLRAGEALDDYEARLRYLAYLRAEVRRRRAA